MLTPEVVKCHVDLITLYGPQCEEMCIFGYIFHIGAGGGGGLPTFQGSKTLSQSRQMYNKEKTYLPFFIHMYGPQCEQMYIFDYSEGGGGLGGR